MQVRHRTAERVIVGQHGQAAQERMAYVLLHRGERGRKARPHRNVGYIHRRCAGYGARQEIAELDACSEHAEADGGGRVG